MISVELSSFRSTAEVHVELSRGIGIALPQRETPGLLGAGVRRVHRLNTRTFKDWMGPARHSLREPMVYMIFAHL